MTLGEDGKGSRRVPVFVRPPADWAELTDERKLEWARDLVRAITGAQEPPPPPAAEPPPESQP
jgi:hypothetical protein